MSDDRLLFPAMNNYYFQNSLQRNEAGSSTGMEFMAFQQCMDFLLAYGLLITTFISDRHVSIAAHMRNVLTNIVHYFDIWHLKKSKNTCISVFTIIVDNFVLVFSENCVIYIHDKSKAFVKALLFFLKQLNYSVKSLFFFLQPPPL